MQLKIVNTLRQHSFDFKQSLLTFGQSGEQKAWVVQLHSVAATIQNAVYGAAYVKVDIESGDYHCYMGKTGHPPSSK